MTNAECSRIISDAMGECWHDPIFVDDGMYYKCKRCGVNNYHYFLHLNAFSPEGFVECLEWAMDDFKHEWTWAEFEKDSFDKWCNKGYPYINIQPLCDYLRFVFNRNSFGCILAEWLVKKGG